MANSQSPWARLATSSIGPCYLIITTLFLIVPITLLAVGIFKFNDCQADSRIPIWLIVIALVMLLERLFGFLISSRDKKFLRENPKPENVEDGDAQVLADWKNRRKENSSKVFVLLRTAVRFAQFVAFVIGCFLVFGIYSISDQCSGLVFWTSYIYCITCLIGYIIGVFFLVCTACCLAAFSSST